MKNESLLFSMVKNRHWPSARRVPAYRCLPLACQALSDAASTPVQKLLSSLFGIWKVLFVDWHSCLPWMFHLERPGLFLWSPCLGVFFLVFNFYFFIIGFLILSFVLFFLCFNFRFCFVYKDNNWFIHNKYLWDFELPLNQRFVSKEQICSACFFLQQLILFKIDLGGSSCHGAVLNESD